MKQAKAFIFTILLLLSLSIMSFADGDGNMDGGGGGMGSGDSNSYWYVGNDGLRITVVRASDNSRAKPPIDLTNEPRPSDIHFGKRSKIDYRDGANLSLQTTPYTRSSPPQPLPQIISPSGATNIAAIKAYLCSEATIMNIAQEVGISYDTLISGNYKLLIEPIAYFTYSGIKIAATAHEAALYDQMTSGDLRSKLGNLTHKNLPLAMFLEYDDLGFPAWSGSTSGFVSNSQIISSLGLGIVRFTDELPENPGGTTDYEYHTDTEVITSISIHGGSSGVSPDENGRITFSVGSQSFTKSYVAPPGESQLVWFKWRTPATPQVVNMSVSVSGGGYVSKNSLKARIVDLEEITPPDPQPRDKPPSGFTVKDPPIQSQISNLSWGYWIPEWEPKWEWDSDWDWVEGTEETPGYWEDNGSWVDNGKWIYHWDAYSATLGVDVRVMPDSRVKTAYTGSYGKVYMPSGYGINIDVQPRYGGSHGGQITKAQNAVVTFPEFAYQTYNRVLEEDSSHGSHLFRFRENLYSQVRHRVHFTPIWFPDFKVYQPQTQVLDCWTRATRS